MTRRVALDDPRLNPTFGEEVNGPGPTYFSDPVIDNLMDTLLALAAEVWETRDRLRLLETALEEQGVEVRQRIEARAAELASPSLRRDCDAFVGRLFEPFLRRTRTPWAGSSEGAQ